MCPQEGKVKLNIDGAVKGSTRDGSCEGILRYAYGVCFGIGIYNISS